MLFRKYFLFCSVLFGFCLLKVYANKPLEDEKGLLNTNIFDLAADDLQLTPADFDDDKHLFDNEKAAGLLGYNHKSPAGTMPLIDKNYYDEPPFNNPSLSDKELDSAIRQHLFDVFAKGKKWDLDGAKYLAFIIAHLDLERVTLPFIRTLLFLTKNMSLSEAADVIDIFNKMTSSDVISFYKLIMQKPFVDLPAEDYIMFIRMVSVLPADLQLILVEFLLENEDFLKKVTVASFYKVFMDETMRVSRDPAKSWSIDSLEKLIDDIYSAFEKTSTFDITQRIQANEPGYEARGSVVRQDSGYNSGDDKSYQSS